MTPERWQQVKKVFDDGLRCEPQRRVPYLADACAGDPEMFSEVQSLLSAHDAAGTFIEDSVFNSGAVAIPEVNIANGWPGRRLGPYKILEEIGRGGMGTVYLAVRDDAQFTRRVAIKLVSRGMDTDFVLRRFRNERQILADLDHPNIARLFDGGSTDDGLPYYVMEYIEGQPLLEFCDRRSLNTAERLRLFREVCAAVHYAHRKQIVHRDLKPSNVLVTNEGIPKLLDFGIARILKTDSTGHTLDATLTAARMMTPYYASPEQVRGEAAGPASDVYSLGVVLFELLTGRRPYQIKNQLPHEIARIICETDPDKPRTAVSRVERIATNDGLAPMTYTPESVSATREGLPSQLRKRLEGDLDAIILKALRKEPGSRYATAEELSEDIRRHLDGSPVSARKGIAGYRSQQFLRRHRIGVLAIAALLPLAAALAWFLQTQRGTAFRETAANLISKNASPASQAPGIPAVAPRRSVAFLGFKNVSGNPQSAWLSTAFSEMLSTEVSAGEKLRTVPGENVARVKLELTLGDADAYGKETLQRLRTNLGSDIVVLGAYTALGRQSGGQIRLDLRLQDTAAGETVASVTETGTEAALLDLVARSGARLREKLGVGEVSANDAAGVRASLPANLEAARLYSEGLAKLRLFDALTARDLLVQASNADPKHPLAHAALASAWSALGYDGKARAEAKQAFDLSANLPREERLSVEGRYREMLNEWGKAVELYQALFQFFPDNLEYGLRLASAQTSAGRGKDALSTIEMLRRFPQPAADDPRIDLAEATAVGALSNFKKEQELEAKAARKGAALGAQLLVARARLLESRALRNLGLPEQARAAAQESRDIFSRANYLEGVARATNNLAALRSDQGNLDQAARLHEESLAISRRIGDQGGVASAYNNLAIRSKDQGNLAEALKLHQQALAIRRETDDKSGIAVSLNNIAVVLYGMDDLSGATKRYEESLALAREIGERRAIVRAQSNLSLVLRDRGELAAARRMQEESMVIRRQIGDKNGLALAQLNLGQVLLDQGDLSGARRLVEQALPVEREINHRRGIAYDLSALGEIALAEGNLPAARKHHEEALKIREQSGEKGTASESRLALASLAVEEGRLSEGERLARSVAGEFAHNKARQFETQAYLVIARPQLAQKKPAEAQSSLNLALPLVHSSERRFLSLSVGLTAARIRAAQGKAVEAQRLLTQVFDAAGKTGYPFLQLEARLALGEIGLHSGNATTTLKELAALQREATARGFGLIAQKTSSLVAAYK